MSVLVAIPATAFYNALSRKAETLSAQWQAARETNTRSERAQANEKI